MPGGLKLLALLVLSSCSLFFGPSALAAATAALIQGSLAAGIRRPWELLRGIRPLLLMLVFVQIFRSVSVRPPAVNYGGFTGGLLFAWGILVSFAAGALLFSTTTMTEIKASLTAAERALFKPLLWLLKPAAAPAAGRLRRRLERPRLGLGISLMLGFLPRFFEIWEGADTAYRARAGKRGLKALLVILPLVTERMLAMAADTACALESRGLEL